MSCCRQEKDAFFSSQHFSANKSKNMDTVEIIDAKRIAKATKICIDQFVNSSETASLLLKPKENAENRERVNSILSRIHGKKYASEEALKSALYQNLRELASEVLLGVASESLREERIEQWIHREDSAETAALDSLDKTSSVNRTFKTFDQNLKDKLYGKERTLRSITDQHSRLVREIKHIKGKYWAYDMKCQAFPSMLKEAILNQSPYEDPPQRKITDSDIKNIRASFSSNIRTASDLWHKLERLQDKEKTLRREMERECRAYKDMVDRHIYKRLQSGLKALKCTVNNTVRDKFWRNKLLNKIKTLDARSVVKTVIEASTWTYSYPENMSCVNEHGFQADIPDPSRQMSCAGLPKANTTQNNQGYVELLSDITSDSSAFIKGQKGSVIKRKISVDGATIAFGWTKKFPWSKKTWGFYKKENASRC